MVVQQGQIQRIGWVIKAMQAQVGQFLLGCKCSVRQGIVVQEHDPLGDLGIFPSKCLSVASAEMNNTLC